MIQKAHSDTSVGLALLLLIAAIYATISALTPWQLDDYLFAAAYRNAAGGFHVDAEAYMEYFDVLRTYDNSRLSNELFPMIVLWPGTTMLFHILTGVMMAGIVWIAARIATGSWRPLAAWIVAIWGMMLLALPWRNSIFVADYTLNYVYSTAIMLAWALLMMRLLTRGLTRWGYAGAALLGLLAAGWHEGFAGPLIVGLVAASLMPPRSKHLGGYIALLVMALMILAICALSPGMLDRVQREVVGEVAQRSVPRLIVNTWLVALTLALAIMGLVTVRGRKLLRIAMSDRWIVLMVVTALCGAVLCAMVLTTPRTSFWPQMAMLIAWMRLACLEDWHIGEVTGRIVGAIILGLILVQSGLSICWQWLLKQEHDEITRRIESGERTIYYDVLHTHDMPKATLFMPASLEFNDKFGIYCLEEYYHCDLLAIVPTALDGNLNSGRRVGDGIYEYCGEIVADHPIGDRQQASTEARVLTNDGTEHRRIYDCVLYRDRAGEIRVWLRARTRMFGDDPIPPRDIVKIEID